MATGQGNTVFALIDNGAYVSDGRKVPMMSKLWIIIRSI